MKQYPADHTTTTTTTNSHPAQKTCIYISNNLVSFSHNERKVVLGKVLAMKKKWDIWHFWTFLQAKK